MSTISSESRAPVALGIPDGASARVVALPFCRFKLRLRGGMFATGVGPATVGIEGGLVRLSARRPPRWLTLAGLLAPLGFVLAAVLLVLASPLPALYAAGATVAAMALVAVLKTLLATREEAAVNAADAFVVAVRRPLGLDRVERLLGTMGWLLPRPLADLVGRRVVVVEASFGADRLAIQRRSLVARRAVTAEALVQCLRAARHPRPRA